MRIKLTAINNGTMDNSPGQGIGKMRCPSDWIVYGGYVILAYTQGDQDIMKAEARTVFALERVLGCA